VAPRAANECHYIARILLTPATAEHTRNGARPAMFRASDALCRERKTISTAVTHRSPMSTKPVKNQ
jgi:hypothetical protein